MFNAKYERIYIEENLVKEIKNFWEYFFDEEEKIIKSLYNNDRNYLLFFEEKLEKVFFRKKGKLRFTFKKEGDVINFTFYYGRSSYLLTVGDELFMNKRNDLKNKWSFILKK